jgi:hypothetical protein
MDFLERMLGVSPDRADGSFEALVLGAVIVCAAAMVWHWRSKRANTSI